MGCTTLVKGEWEQLDRLVAQPLLQSIMPATGPFRGCFFNLFCFLFACLFAVGSGCDKDVFPKTDKLPWETVNEALTTIEDLTALENEKLTQRNLDKCLLSALPPWNISLVLMWKSKKNWGGVISAMGNHALD